MKFLSTIKKIGNFGIANAVSRSTNLLLVPLFVHKLSISRFGLLDLYITCGMLIFIVCESQISSGFSRFYYESKKSNQLNLLIKSAIAYYIASWLLLFTIFFIMIFFSVKIKNFNYLALLPIIAGVFPQQIWQLRLTYFRLSNRDKLFLVYNCLFTAITLSCSVALVLFHPSIVMCLWGLNIAYIILFPIHLIAFKRESQKKKKQVEFNYIPVLCRYSLPTVPSVLGGWLMGYSSRFIILKYLSLKELGIYALIARVGSVIGMILQTFRLVWTPKMMYYFSKPAKIAESAFKDVMDYYIYFGLLATQLTYVVSPILIFLIAPIEYQSSYRYVLYASLSFFCQGFNVIAATGNDWVKKTYLNTYSYITGAVISVILQLLFVKFYGIYMALLANVVGSFITGVLTLLSSQRVRYIPFRKGVLLIGGAFVVFLTIWVYIQRLHQSLLFFYTSNFILFFVMCGVFYQFLRKRTTEKSLNPAI